VNGSAQGTGVLGMAQQKLQQLQNPQGTNQNQFGISNFGTGVGGTNLQDTKGIGATGPNLSAMNTNWGANSGGPSGQPNQNTSSQGILGQFKSPTDVVARNYLTANPSTQNMITSAISQNTGLNQADIDSSIKSTLPKQSGPAFGLASI